jgi:hypothetical protein
VLDLERTPRYLRVVHDSETWQWDALDQLDDEPKPTEKIFVYRRGELARGFACRGRRGGGCRTFIDAEYSCLPVHPADADLRDNGKWRKWVEGLPKPDDSEPKGAA